MTEPTPMEKDSQQFADEMQALILQYDEDKISPVDLIERLKDLDRYEFHDLFLWKFLRHCLDAKDEDQALMIETLKLCASAGIFSAIQVKPVIEKFVQTVTDLELDVRDAADRIIDLVEFFVSEKLLDPRTYNRLSQQFIKCLKRPEQIEAFSEQLLSLQQFKKVCEEFARNSFPEIPLDDATNFLEETPESRFNHEFIRIILRISLSYSDLQREATSKLMNGLYDLLEPDDIKYGFSRVLGAIDDLLLDNPQVVTQCAKFLSRAVTDEILPPSFLHESLRLHIGGIKGMEAFRTAIEWLNPKSHHMSSVRMSKIWTGTDPANVTGKEFKHLIRQTIYSFLDHHDYKETTDEINQMDLSPDQLSETVRKVLTFTMDRKNEQMTFAIRLLDHLLQNGEITKQNVLQGLRDYKNHLRDLVKDDPHVFDKFATYLKVIEDVGLLTKDEMSSFLEI